MKIIKCEYGCNREAKFILKNGKHICSKSPNTCPIIKKINSETGKISYKNKNRKKYCWSKENPPWNKGLKKETSEKMFRSTEASKNTLIKKIKNGFIPPFVKWAKSEIGRKILSQKRSDFLQNKSCQCKKFEFNNGKRNIYVQGTWEKQFVEFLIKNNIKWDRTRIFYDKVRTYTPDFYLPDFNCYIEIKGWMRERDIIKMKKVLNEHYIDLRLVDSKKILNNLQNGLLSIKDLEKFSNRKF
jgi:hypothetical protein